MVRPGIVATDPRVIPLGTKFKINGKTVLAADTGSYIIGRRIDIWMESCREAINFGMRRVVVESIRKAGRYRERGTSMARRR